MQVGGKAWGGGSQEKLEAARVKEDKLEERGDKVGGGGSGWRRKQEE